MLAGYTFEPASRTYTAITDDQLSQDYTATLIVPTITVTSPNGGENLSIGTTHNITWKSSNITGTLKITLLIRSSGFHPGRIQKEVHFKIRDCE
jgi:hypothetical protein